MPPKKPTNSSRHSRTPSSLSLNIPWADSGVTSSTRYVPGSAPLHFFCCRRVARRKPLFLGHTCASLGCRDERSGACILYRSASSLRSRRRPIRPIAGPKDASPCWFFLGCSCMLSGIDCRADRQRTHRKTGGIGAHQLALQTHTPRLLWQQTARQRRNSRLRPQIDRVSGGRLRLGLMLELLLCRFSNSIAPSDSEHFIDQVYERALADMGRWRSKIIRPPINRSSRAFGVVFRRP